MNFTRERFVPEWAAVRRLFARRTTGVMQGFLVALAAVLGGSLAFVAPSDVPLRRFAFTCALAWAGL